MRPRLVVRFAIDGDLRFLSHRDMMRTFERALARAGWPVRFTEGFNPRPRLSLPLPRSVGTASDDELLVVELTQAVDPDGALCGLARQVPSGIRLVAAGAVADAPRPLRVRYELALKGPASGLDQAIEAFLNRTSLLVARSSHEGRAARDVDIRPFVEALARTGDCLEMVLRVTPRGAAKPSEVLDALGLPGTELGHRLRRTHVDWSQSVPPLQSEGSKERTSWKTVTDPVCKDPVAEGANGGSPPGRRRLPPALSENPNS